MGFLQEAIFFQKFTCLYIPFSTSLFFFYQYIVTYTISPTLSFLIGVGLSMTYDMVLVEESPSAETEKITRIQSQSLPSIKVSTEQ